jgi:hypothetical protein
MITSVLISNSLYDLFIRKFNAIIKFIFYLFIFIVNEYCSSLLYALSQLHESNEVSILTFIYVYSFRCYNYFNLVHSQSVFKPCWLASDCPTGDARPVFYTLYNILLYLSMLYCFWVCRSDSYYLVNYFEEKYSYQISKQWGKNSFTK